MEDLHYNLNFIVLALIIVGVLAFICWPKKKNTNKSTETIRVQVTKSPKRRYTRVKKEGGDRYVYDSETGDWVLWYLLVDSLGVWDSAEIETQFREIDGFEVSTPVLSVDIPDSHTVSSANHSSSGDYGGSSLSDNSGSSSSSYSGSSDYSGSSSSSDYSSSSSSSDYSSSSSSSDSSW